MADEITQADRELLAAEYERNGLLAVAKSIRANRLIRRDAVALRAIAAARRQGQAASGGEVVAVAWRTRHRDVEWSFTTRPHPGDIARGIWQPLYTAPPSAPVGVEKLAGEWSAHAATPGIPTPVACAFDTCAQMLRAALAQQPATSPDVRRRPNAREVARIGDMDPYDAMRIGFDGDNDVYLCVTSGIKGVEFCVPGSGGGKSPRTRDALIALIALMVAVEEDNAADPRRNWWARRNAAAQQEGAP